MDLNFDVVISDVTTPRSYELQTLEVEGIGGTEASVIRVAEGLGALGFKVAVLEHNLDIPLTGKNAYYLPLSYIDRVNTDKCRAYIALRGAQFVERFPKSKKFSWHQDVPNHVMLQLKPKFLEHDVTVIAVSRWHKTAIQSLICDPNETINPKVVYCYNPVPDKLMVPREIKIKYDENKLVWPASPHKGLDRAIELVGHAIEVSGNKKLKLHIFNPGYFHKDYTWPSWVVNHDSVPCADLWQEISESLCVFYPTSFQETFGCIAAEANAVHTPVLTHPIAALSETVAGKQQFCGKDNKSIIDTLIKWNKGERPEVYGQERFKLSEVLKQWLKLIIS